MLFVEPGSPWENGYTEFLRSRMRALRSLPAAQQPQLHDTGGFHPTVVRG